MNHFWKATLAQFALVYMSLSVCSCEKSRDESTEAAIDGNVKYIIEASVGVYYQEHHKWPLSDELVDSVIATDSSFRRLMMPDYFSDRGGVNYAVSRQGANGGIASREGSCFYILVDNNNDGRVQDDGYTYPVSKRITVLTKSEFEKLKNINPKKT